MKQSTRRFRVAISVSALFAAALSGCTNFHPGNSRPTDKAGQTMTLATPGPPPGWKVQEAIPQSQQQAQNTVVGYLRRTLAELPSGSVIDGGRYLEPGKTPYCDDNDSSPTAPRRFSTIGELQLPPGSESVDLIAKVGDTWRSWGWYVVERDVFTKPNRFGYAPDGYRLQIEAASQQGYPPTIQGSSPCFPGAIAREDIPIPVVINAE